MLPIDTCKMHVQFRTRRYNGSVMSRKPRKKKKKSGGQRPAPAKKNAKYSAGEIAMAILGAAILIMVAGIIIESLLR